VNRVVSLLLATVVTAFGAVCPTGVAAAAPAADAFDCVFTLSRPEPVAVSGTTVVSATLTPSSCTGQASPNSSTVCVFSADDSNEHCADGRGWNPAMVSTSYRVGQSYTSRASGCFTATVSGATVCRTFGPVAVRL
jgi:hypothetical protein